MELTARIYVAGHRGLAGSAIVQRLQRAGHEHILTRSHADLDLIDAAATRRFFEAERPEHVFLAAAQASRRRPTEPNRLVEPCAAA